MADPIVTAAVPSLIATLQALQAFVANLGTDPTQVPIKFPGALQVLLGSIEMQFPSLVTSEFGAAQTAANGAIAGWIQKLEAIK